MDLGKFCSSSKVVIVAGKGGVGKTTVAATLAVVASRAGKKVLIVEVEGKSGLATMFGKEPLTYEEAELAPGVWARTLTPDQALVDYLDTHGLKRVSKRLVKSGAADIVATAAPGMKDILVLGKVKSIEKHEDYDLVVVDGPAAGHAITFLTSPAGLLDAVRVGPIRKQALEVNEMLSDAARCRTMLVTIAEETPVNEAVETAFALEDRVGLSLTPIVVNALYTGLDDGAQPEEAVEDTAEEVVTPAAVRGVAEEAGVFVSDREAHDLAAAAEFHRLRHVLQMEQVERLGAKLPLHQLHLPFLPRTQLTPSDLDVLADAFTAAVEAIPGAP